MPKIDLKLIGRKSEPVVFDYTWRDVVLYALGVGASVDDLSFIYENAEGGLKVLPSFCVVPAIRAFPRMEGDLDWSLMLHGEQHVRVHRPLPAQGRMIQVGELTRIYDKGKGALIQIEIKGSDEGGHPLYDIVWSIFYVGGGGFGGDPGPRPESLAPPPGAPPDFSVAYTTTENQAALYRLSGDLNPLHLDPEAARRGGFDRPILHGLCTYGIATRAIVNKLLTGDVSRFREFKARFSSVVFPGDTITTEGWKDGDGRYLIQCRTERGVVLSQAYARIS